MSRTQGHVDTAGGVTLTSVSEQAEYHLTDQFLKFVSMIRKVMEAPDVTLFAVRVAVMSADLPMLGQWIIGLPLTLTGHAV